MLMFSVFDDVGVDVGLDVIVADGVGVPLAVSLRIFSSIKIKI